MPTPIFQPYTPGIKDDINGKIKGLTNAYTDTMQQLQWILSHLDEKNVIRARSVTADWVYAGNVTTDQLIAGEALIETAMIENLIVGANVEMGPDATISWSKVTEAPTIPVLPTYIKSTYIDSTNVVSPNITGGTITSNTTINVGTDAIIGNNLYLGNQSDLLNDKTIYFNNSSRIIGDGEKIIISAQVFELSAVYVSGTWNFTNATVTGLSTVAKFA